DTAWPVVVLAYLHAQQQHVAVWSEIDAVMEGLGRDWDAVCGRGAIAISSGGVPLVHDCAGERHLKDEPVDNADEQVGVWQVPYGLQGPIGLINATDAARLIDAEEPSTVRRSHAGSGVATHIEQHHARLAPMWLAAHDADGRQIVSVHCHRGAITSLVLRTICAGVRTMSAPYPANSSPDIGKRSAPRFSASALNAGSLIIAWNASRSTCSVPAGTPGGAA